MGVGSRMSVVIGEACASLTTRAICTPRTWAPDEFLTGINICCSTQVEKKAVDKRNGDTLQYRRQVKNPGKEKRNS